MLQTSSEMGLGYHYGNNDTMETWRFAVELSHQQFIPLLCLSRIELPPFHSIVPLIFWTSVWYHEININPNPLGLEDLPFKNIRTQECKLKILDAVPCRAGSGYSQSQPRWLVWNAEAIINQMDCWTQESNQNVAEQISQNKARGWRRISCSWD